MKDKYMQNTIFITVAGGLVQSINITDDLENIEVVVIDFDKNNSKDPAMLYRFRTDKIDDGDVETFEKMIKEV